MLFIMADYAANFASLEAPAHFLEKNALFRINEN